MTADVNAMKSKTSVASFQQTSQPRAVQTNAPKKGHFLFSSQSRASYSQPHCKKTPARAPSYNKPNCHPANRFIATGTHSVFSHENQRCHHSGLFFTYKTLRKSGVEKGRSNYSQKHNNVRNVIRYERDSEGVEISLCWRYSISITLTGV